MRILICGAALLALISTAFAAPLSSALVTPIAHKSSVTKADYCSTTCRWIGNQQVCNTYCF
jgi:hypothetical protein